MMQSVCLVAQSYALLILLIDVFRFTLYWTLIFYTPLFLLCGSYAFWNYAFPPSAMFRRGKGAREPAYQLSRRLPASSQPVAEPQPAQPTTHPKMNERRSRVTFAFIVLLTFLTLSVAGAVVASAILGFVAYGLYKSANFNMSTFVLSTYSVNEIDNNILR